MTQNRPTQAVNYAEIGGPVSYELAVKMVKDYQDAHADENPVCFTIGRNIIEQVLAQPDCVAMRFYNAIGETGEPTLVYAGVDSKGRTIVEYPIITENGKLGKIEALQDRSQPNYTWFGD